MDHQNIQVDLSQMVPVQDTVQAVRKVHSGERPKVTATELLVIEKFNAETGEYEGCSVAIAEHEVDLDE